MKNWIQKLLPVLAFQWVLLPVSQGDQLEILGEYQNENRGKVMFNKVFQLGEPSEEVARNRAMQIAKDEAKNKCNQAIIDVVREMCVFSMDKTKVTVDFVPPNHTGVVYVDAVYERIRTRTESPVSAPSQGGNCDFTVSKTIQPVSTLLRTEVFEDKAAGYDYFERVVKPSAIQTAVALARAKCIAAGYEVEECTLLPGFPVYAYWKEQGVPSGVEGALAKVRGVKYQKSLAQRLTAEEIKTATCEKLDQCIQGYAHDRNLLENYIRIAKAKGCL